MLKAIIFDVDGVLTDSLKANAAFYQKLFVKAGYPKPPVEAITSRNHLTLEGVVQDIVGPLERSELERIWTFVRQPGMYDVELLEFAPRLQETLELLHKRYRLAIVTGRARSGTEDVLKQANIEPLFEAIVGFHDYTNAKPHPEPLLKACEVLGVKPNEAVYVGDSDVDIEAAKAAHMKSIHLAAQTSPGATVGVQVFAELAQAIEKLVSDGK